MDNVLKQRLDARIKKLQRDEGESHSECAKSLKSCKKSIYWLRPIAIGVLLVTPFFHRPRWC